MAWPALFFAFFMGEEGQVMLGRLEAGAGESPVGFPSARMSCQAPLSATATSRAWVNRRSAPVERRFCG